jgi:hypothetical protein
MFNKVVLPIVLHPPTLMFLLLQVQLEHLCPCKGGQAWQL